MSTEKKSTDALLFVKDGTKVVRSVSTADMQIGTPTQPAELQVTGRFSQSVAVVSAKPGQTINLSDKSSSIVCVKTSAGTGNVTLLLPQNPRQGQTVYVKDATGTAATNNIVVRCSNTKVKIDGQETKSMSVKYESSTFVWTGEEWLALDGASKQKGPQGEQGKQGTESLALNFSATGFSNDANPGLILSSYNGYLWPGMSTQKPTGFVSDPSASTIGIVAPFSGKITSFTVLQKFSSALPLDVGYYVTLNGYYNALGIKANVFFPKNVFNKSLTWKGELPVTEGDVISVIEAQANPAASGDEIEAEIGVAVFLSACIVLTKS